MTAHDVRHENGRDDDLTVTGMAPATRRAQYSWALFDWANQPYFTLVTTFIFAPYFTSHVVGNAIRGQELWGYGQAAAGLCIALLSPVMGAMADASGRRKPWILGFQALCVVACAGLWLALPGAADRDLMLILGLIVLASVGAEFATVFNNAMLPGLVSRARLGRLSGYAWALGYLGGLVSLGFVLGGFSLPEVPLFGLDKASHEHDRMVGPLSAIWMVIFIVPLLIFTPDAPPSGLSPAKAARQGLRQLGGTLKSLRHYRNVMLFLIARMIYFDGLSAIFAFGGIYAAGIFGWSTTNLGVFGIILIIFAALGAMVGGWLDDRIGSKRTILLAVAGLIIATLGIVSITVDGLGTEGRQDTVLYFIQYQVVASGEGMFTTRAEQIFLLFGIMVGMFGGPAQAASRTMVSRLVPVEKIGEFYGLYALSGKATAFIAPLVVALITGMLQSQRAGIAAIVVFLALGLLLMLPVREERAKRPS
ncbi:MAG: MFS transporter [Alphaproteobacteria bacterium]|jgi:UMF1 family MFS transporter|nr:MFS transporter [Alphaproteobacteria bacterium]MDP6253566.1 MFS transporter [Alphaproteobacteria bacterium]MDP7054020.1 MFS transporter [Alphaproteobacteria bacterium]MDP7227331.1 MFS transporter [Alphaproteobacteria bacterium]MDP7461276.1 MFS transporter [Alphaproteobacteria bacterium]|tara:strand:- start:97 stop:1530 length:1434 start_codon:yes stop_codon:yes gene_type:complete